MHAFKLRTKHMEHNEFEVGFGKQARIEVIRERSERLYDVLFKSNKKKFIKNNKKEQVQWMCTKFNFYFL